MAGGTAKTGRPGSGYDTAKPKPEFETLRGLMHVNGRMVVPGVFSFRRQRIVVALLQPVLLALQPEGVHAGRKLRVRFGDPDGLAVAERLPLDAFRRGAAA